MGREDFFPPDEPFDYHRHLVQVVAVDHITQAARVALVDDEVLTALETPFVEYARQVAEALRREQEQQGQCLQALQVKSIDELDPSLVELAFLEGCEGLTLLISPELREVISARLTDWNNPVRLRDFDPSRFFDPMKLRRRVA